MSDKAIPVKVALRIRPLNQREKNDACSECLRTISNEPQVIIGKDKPFTYDYVFGKNTPQIDIYEASVQPLLDALFKGYNATVLAYGQTGSGKTFTMGSGYAALSSAMASVSNVDIQTSSILNLNDLDEVGVIPRVLNDLFTRIDDEQNSNKELKFSVKVSFVEVYNEEIKDLFSLKGTQETLNIREENNTIRVMNLSEIEVKNSITTIQLLERGSQGRVVGGTAMNDQSSRSHAIFTITLEQANCSSQSGSSSDNGGLIKSKFHLVDLAGSERQSKTKAEGIRLKEGININLGLLALGNVISVLGEENPGNKAKHVPYRESKLTRLLQDSLGGNSHTVMIACVSPADSNMEESLNTLRYADRARKIKNKPIVNIDPQMAELNSLRQQVQELKAHIYHLTGGTGVHQTPQKAQDNSAELANIKEENERLRIENKSLLVELQRITISNRTTYERYMQLETERDDQKQKFEEIKIAFQKVMRESEENAANLTQQSSLDQTVSQNKTLFNELQSKMQEFEQIKKQSSEIENEPEVSDLNEPMEKDYALRQAKMQCQLSEYDTELAKKEILFQKMVENTVSMRYEAQLDEFKHRIEALQKEKEDLIANKSSDNKRPAEVRKERLKQLEGEVHELKKKEKDFVRMVRLKEENEKHCEKLRLEIQSIKTERVKLLKQMKVETDTFRKFRQQKEKEVNQLKAVERKRLVEITKLQEGNNRQEAVLKRKNEEITRIQKQLRETLEKQKQVAEKRQQNFDRKDSSHLGDKLRNWITQELDLSVDIAVARINLNNLIEERKESAAELNRLQEKLKELEDFANEAPGSKRKLMANFSDEEYESPMQLEEKIERIKEDIEGKSLQINEIQQMVIEGEQEDRSKYIFNTVHGLLEAKVLLKHLYNSGVQYLLDLKLKQIQYESATNKFNRISQELRDLKKKYESTEEELIKTKKNSSREISDLQNYYEQRILCFLKTTMNDLNKTDVERYNIIYDTLQNMEKRFEKNNVNIFAEPQPVRKRDISDMTNKEDYRRVQKAKKDHRRTRVIYKVPEVDVSLVNDQSKNVSSINNTTICFDVKENSFSDSLSVDDNSTNDPDWSKTPIHRRPRRTINRKSGIERRRSKLTKNSSNITSKYGESAEASLNN